MLLAFLPRASSVSTQSPDSSARDQKSSCGTLRAPVPDTHAPAALAKAQSLVQAQSPLAPPFEEEVLTLRNPEVLLLWVAVRGDCRVLRCGGAVVYCPQHAAITLSALESLDEEPVSPIPGS